jgi:hypothetical protein
LAHAPGILIANEPVLSETEQVDTRKEAKETARGDEVEAPWPGHTHWSFDAAAQQVIATLEAMAGQLASGCAWTPQRLRVFCTTVRHLLSQLQRGGSEGPDVEGAGEPGTKQPTYRERIKGAFPAFPRGRFNSSEMAALLGCQPRTISSLLSKMIQKGELRKGKGKGWFVIPREARKGQKRA